MNTCLGSFKNNCMMKNTSLYVFQKNPQRTKIKKGGSVQEHWQILASSLVCERFTCQLSNN